MILLTVPLTKTWSDEARIASAEIRRRKGVKAIGDEEARRVTSQWTQEYGARDLAEVTEHAQENQTKLENTAQQIAEATGAEARSSGAKKIDSLAAKIARGKRANEITDATRIGFKVNTPAQADRVVEELGKHFEAADEGWRHTAAGYFDRTVKVRFPNGQVGEIQLWPPGLLEAKSSSGGGGHHLYKEMQAATDPVKRKEFEGQMKKLYKETKKRLPAEWNKILKEG